MKKLLSIFIALISVPAIAADTDEILRQLDIAIEQAYDYEQHKLWRIQQLKDQEQSAVNLEEQYWILRKIADEYSVYLTDSALAYGGKILSIATALGRQDLINDAHILNAYTLAAAGILNTGRRELEQVDTAALDEISRPRYQNQLVYQISHEDQFIHVSGNSMTAEEAQAVMDSLMLNVSTAHPDYYYYLGYQALKSPQAAREAIEQILPVISDCKFDSREDARLGWIMSQLYSAIGDTDNEIKYLALSAMADIRTANRDIASLEILAGILNQRGDLDRAYRYIGHTIKCAEQLQNRVRVLNVSLLQSEISRKYQERAARLQRMTRVYIIILGALALILVVAIIYIASQRTRLRKAHADQSELNKELNSRLKELTEAYARLAENNDRLLQVSDELTESNRRLGESNQVNINCIGSLFSICSEYIDKLEKFRRTINRKLKAKQYAEVLEQTASHELAQTEVKEFYNYFDSLFLSMYPTFVSDFNEILPDEEKIIPKHEGRLNTDLRIFALIRMGITDSVKIATLLHCSPQTIYNKRFKLRSATGLSKDELIARVRQMGGFQS